MRLLPYSTTMHMHLIFAYNLKTTALTVKKLKKAFNAQLLK